MAVLAGIDFFTVEVLTWRGLVTYYALFFLHLETRRVTLGGITRHPTEMWMEQVARNAIDEPSGASPPRPIRSARSRYEVLRIVSGHIGDSWRQMHHPTGTESEFERIC